MSDKTLFLEIISPSKIIFSGKINSVSVPGEIGNFQILYNHAPIISTLTIGEIKFITESNETFRFATNGGFVMVLKNRVTIVSDSLIKSTDIDVKEVERELSKFKEEIKEKRKKGNVENLEMLIAQLENKIRVASKAD